MYSIHSGVLRPTDEETIALEKSLWDTWVAQLVERPILGFCSGHDLRDVRLSLVSGSTLHTESASPFGNLCFYHLARGRGNRTIFMLSELEQDTEGATL